VRLCGLLEESDDGLFAVRWIMCCLLRLWYFIYVTLSSHLDMRHVARVHESCRTHMSHVSHTCVMSHTHESCLTCIRVTSRTCILCCASLGQSHTQYCVCLRPDACVHAVTRHGRCDTRAEVECTCMRICVTYVTYESMLQRLTHMSET